MSDSSKIVASELRKSEREPAYKISATRPDAAGFALAMVVFLLFAVAIAGLTGYQIVSVEAALASGNGDANLALTVANGGLHRYVAERIGEAGADTYLIGRGSVTVWSEPLKVDTERAMD